MHIVHRSFETHTSVPSSGVIQVAKRFLQTRLSNTFAWNYYTNFFVYQNLCDSRPIGICHLQPLLHRQDFPIWCGPLFRSNVVLPVSVSIPFPTSERWKGLEFAPTPKIKHWVPELDRKIRICTAASRTTGSTKITDSRVRYSHEREPPSFAHQGPRTLPLTRPQLRRH